ncbi:MAG: tRNA (adenosine(37)-N6)-dimethylallyltransferase MiaA [Coriobacteriales bacterium]|nr:tRNA (adenosine(37)-N6)-dimethylallyltransferase MiaA [Coriobacteriales bacterium]
MSASRVLCIVGPTAVGKSSLAELVALRLGGEVVSVDSMQVYRGMDIGTSKTPPSERKVALHMVDVAEVGEAYSVARFQSDARACVEELYEEGKPAILCGGTGLYLDAVIDEMDFPHGETGGRARSPYERLADEQGAAAVYQLLVERDPKSAEEIHPNNVRRVVRALEMLDEGKSYAVQHAGLKKRKPHYEARIWGLSLPREQLYERINARVDEMFEQGLVDEVRALERAGIRDSLTASQAIGYKEVLGALAGTYSLEEARELVKRNTRRYAKRQLSWLRRDGRTHWIDLSEQGADEACELICADWRQA